MISSLRTDGCWWMLIWFSCTRFWFHADDKTTRGSTIHVYSDDKTPRGATIHVCSDDQNCRPLRCIWRLRSSRAYFCSLRCLLLLYCVLDLHIGERFVAEVLNCSAGTFAYSRWSKIPLYLPGNKKRASYWIFFRGGGGAGVVWSWDFGNVFLQAGFEHVAAAASLRFFLFSSRA